jgi:hypothetical protein
MNTLVRVLKPLLPLALIEVGSELQRKDANTTGADDVVGGIMVAAGPALTAINNGNEAAARKAVRAIRDTCNTYLGDSQAPGTDIQPRE